MKMRKPSSEISHKHTKDNTLVHYLLLNQHFIKLFRENFTGKIISTHSSDPIHFYGILHTGFVQDVATVIVPFWCADYIDNYNERQWKVYFITLKLSEAPG